MGNLKSRLFRKKDDHSASTKGTNANAGQQHIDEQIMNAPNRARAAHTIASDTASVPATVQEPPNTAQKTTTARART